MKAKCYRLDYNELGLSTLCVEKDKEIERLNNIINKAKEKAIDLEKKYGYILGDLIYLLMQGSDKEGLIIYLKKC